MIEDHPGTRLFKARKACGLTRVGLSILSGVSPQAIMLIEKGKCRPRKKTLDKLAKPLGIAFYGKETGYTNCVWCGKRFMARRAVYLADERGARPKRPYCSSKCALECRNLRSK